MNHNININHKNIGFDVVDYNNLASDGFQQSLGKTIMKFQAP